MSEQDFKSKDDDEMRNSYYEKCPNEAYKYYVVTHQGDFEIFTALPSSSNPYKAWESQGWIRFSGPFDGYDQAIKSVSL